MADQLFNIRSKFFVGDYSQVLGLVGAGSFDDSVKEELETIKYRSLINLNNIEQVLNDISPSEEQPHLSAIRSLAVFLSPSTTEEQRKAIISSFDNEKLQKKNALSSTYSIIYALILSGADQLENAYSVLAGISNESLETLSLQVSILLTMHLHEKADVVINKMKSVNADALLTNLSVALSHLYNGRAKDAAEIFDDLIERYGRTSYLLTQRGIASFQMLELQSAENYFNEALRIQPNNGHALVSILALLHRKPLQTEGDENNVNSINKQIEVYTQTLAKNYPTHPFLQQASTMHQALEELKGK